MAGFASRLIAELIGQAFIDGIERGRHRSADRARAAWTWFRQVADAPPGIELVAPDGALYTGIVLVDRGRAVFLLAVRRAEPSHSRREREDWSDHRHRQPSFFEEDEPVQDERNPLYYRR